MDKKYIERPQSDKTARQRAQEKYASKVDTITLRVDPKINEMFKNYSREQGITKKDLFEKAVQYYIDNH